MKIIPKGCTVKLTDLHEFAKIISEEIDNFEKLFVQVEDYRHIRAFTPIDESTREREIPYEVNYPVMPNTVFPEGMTFDELKYHLSISLSRAEYLSDKIIGFLNEVRDVERTKRVGGFYVTGIELTPICTFEDIEPVNIFFRARVSVNLDAGCNFISLFPRKEKRMREKMQKGG